MLTRALKHTNARTPLVARAWQASFPPSFSACGSMMWLARPLDSTASLPGLIALTHRTRAQRVHHLHGSCGVCVGTTGHQETRPPVMHWLVLAQDTSIVPTPLPLPSRECMRAALVAASMLLLICICFPACVSARAPPPAPPFFLHSTHDSHTHCCAVVCDGRQARSCAHRRCASWYASPARAKSFCFT